MSANDHVHDLPLAAGARQADALRDACGRVAGAWLDGLPR